MLRALLQQWNLSVALPLLGPHLAAPAGSTEEIVGVSLTELGLDPDSYFIDLGKIFNLCKPQLLNNTCLSTEKSLRTG